MALENLYATIPHKAALVSLISNREEELDTKLDAAVGIAIAELRKQQPELMGPVFSEIESTRIKRMLTRFILRDSERDDFTSSLLEKQFTLSLQGLELSLKIDRIDQLNDGSFALIDYKTGSTIKAISSLQHARPEEMQLPVYSTAVTRDANLDVSALAIAQVNLKAIGYKALARGANFDPSIAPLTGGKPTAKDKTLERDLISDAEKWAEIRTSWATLVDELGAEFVAGESRVAPIKSATVCEYCRLQSVCRITALRADDGFEADDENDGAEA
jgi:ATP-dependent helicase/DNAse subunit B